MLLKEIGKERDNSLNEKRTPTAPFAMGGLNSILNKKGRLSGLNTSKNY